MSAFVGVEFDSDSEGALALVHASWLTPRKREVFWPPFKAQNRFDKALKRGQEPEQGTWPLYKIKRIFFESGSQ